MYCSVIPDRPAGPRARSAHVSHQDQLTLPENVSTSSEVYEDNSILLQVDIRLHLDDVARLEARLLRSAARRPPTKAEMVELATRIYNGRRVRDRMLDAELFGEPAWDMLLALYCLPKRGLLMTVSALCYSSGVPHTTALRWQKTMKHHGLTERGPEGVDRRKQIVRLTPHGRLLLETYLTRLFYDGATIGLKMNEPSK